MIEVKNLCKVFGERYAVNDISFTVAKGEIVGFLGQNGAGKTTTMKIITCFSSATSGSASVAGYDVFDAPMEVKKRVGYLPENPPLYHEMLVHEYLSFVSDLKGVPSKLKSSRMDAVIAQCQLGDVRKRLIGNLSKGYRQRVGLAQALIHDPEVLVLDEPTVGLDPKQVSEARGLIKDLKKERTVIYSTHILSEVAATCDRILIIDKGKIVAQESLKELASGNKTEVLVHKPTESLSGLLKSISGVRDVQHSPGSNRYVVMADASDVLCTEIAKVVVQSGAGLLRMQPAQLALEEYYLGLIGARRVEQ